LSRISLSWLVLVAALPAPACVVGAERAPTRLEAARAGQAWSGGDPNERSACVKADEGPTSPPPSRSAVWVEGDCRWNGVEHVHADGRWEERGVRGGRDEVRE